MSALLPARERLVDPFGRIITYVRLSVTDRCDFRCLYCMPKDAVFLPKAGVLSLEELQRLGETLIDLGIDKIRITGGEPLVRRGIMTLFRALGARIGDGGLSELTLTTNGSQLSQFAKGLYQAGVRRINVSLDSLKAETFEAIARPGKFDDVMAGIGAAEKAGLKIKINTVALKDINDAEIPDILRWCGERGFDLSLIEAMPVGEVDGRRSQHYLPLPKVKEALERAFTLEETDYRTAGPSRYFRVRETGRRIGFITPLSHKFCETCNRVRVTCTGRMYMCLGQNDHADLRTPLRASEGNGLLKAAIREAIARKPEQHFFEKAAERGEAAVARTMNVTGG
ncbi:MAG TPA: GTP 3',8-cyclase MoaA [Sphingomonadales bacterium]|nr:GTP 3',8-cyclase MoaA [Sphingomonadales bacterium]